MTTTIENGAKLTFENEFMHLAQQQRSKLESSPAVRYVDPDGKTHNLSRMGAVELTEVNSRNPRKQYVDYKLDNRQFTKRRFTASILIDEKDDINELLKDPTSDLMQELLKAKGRVIDRVICEAAGGDVLVGRPDRAPTSVSAASDGVITVNATAGLTAAKIQEVIENYINADLDMDDIMNTTFLATGKENTALMNETKFISNDYISGRPVETGVQKKASAFNVVLFAGSSSGAGTKANPVLDESASSGTVRTCLALAPKSVAVMMKLARFDVKDADDYVNSKSLTIDLWIGAMRTEGVRVQKVTTTI